MRVALRCASILVTSCAGRQDAVVTIPDGRYVIGCNDPIVCAGNPLTTVHVGRYRIDRRLVVRSQYTHCVAQKSCPPMDTRDAGEDEVAFVTYSGATGYCRWRHGRLPTASEWEAAGRGPRGYAYPWGDQMDASHRFRYGIRDLSPDRAVAYPRSGINSQAASVFGVEDMGGVASEFVDAVPLQVRGASAFPNPRVEPGDYTLMKMRDASTDTVAAFRCAYDVPSS
jgi:formylglycine-generating enzyme required for sulfatase activity